MSIYPALLVAEDEEGDVLLLKRAFREAGLEREPRFVSDGEEVVEVLKAAIQRTEPLPALIVLDLNMPRMGGIEAIKWIRAQPMVRDIPVVIFSSSGRAADIAEAYASGANAYLVKPVSISARVDIARFLKDWTRLVSFPPSSALRHWTTPAPS